MSNLDCSFGRRVMLSKGHTELLLCGSSNLSLLNLIRHRSTQIKHSIYIPGRTPTIPKAKGIWGCNWGIKKELLVKINGFDEDYVKAGVGEDVDVEWRLREAKIPILYAKHRAIVYHLYHASHYDSTVVAENMKMLKYKQQQGALFCTNGINKK